MFGVSITCWDQYEKVFINLNLWSQNWKFKGFGQVFIEIIIIKNNIKFIEIYPVSPCPTKGSPFIDTVEQQLLHLAMLDLHGHAQCSLYFWQYSSSRLDTERHACHNSLSKFLLFRVDLFMENGIKGISANKNWVSQGKLYNTFTTEDVQILYKCFRNCKLHYHFTIANSKIVEKQSFFMLYKNDTHFTT